MASENSVGRERTVVMQGFRYGHDQRPRPSGTDSSVARYTYVHKQLPPDSGRDRSRSPVLYPPQGAHSAPRPKLAIFKPSKPLLLPSSGPSHVNEPGPCHGNEPEPCHGNEPGPSHGNAPDPLVDGRYGWPEHGWPNNRWVSPVPKPPFYDSVKAKAMEVVLISGGIRHYGPGKDVRGTPSVDVIDMVMRCLLDEAKFPRECPAMALSCFMTAPPREERHYEHVGTHPAIIKQVLANEAGMAMAVGALHEWWYMTFPGDPEMDRVWPCKLALVCICKSGKHRSVAIATIIGAFLSAQGWNVNFQNNSDRDWQGTCRGKCEECRHPMSIALANSCVIRICQIMQTFALWEK